MERNPRAQRHVKACPENGKSHDCAFESIEGMPVETFDDLIRLAKLEGLAEGWTEGFDAGKHGDGGQVNPYPVTA